MKQLLPFAHSREGGQTLGLKSQSTANIVAKTRTSTMFCNNKTFEFAAVGKWVALSPLCSGISLPLHTPTHSYTLHYPVLQVKAEFLRIEFWRNFFSR
jgi:hypothetical protein